MPSAKPAPRRASGGAPRGGAGGGAGRASGAGRKPSGGERGRGGSPVDPVVPTSDREDRRAPGRHDASRIPRPARALVARVTTTIARIAARTRRDPGRTIVPAPSVDLGPRAPVGPRGAPLHQSRPREVAGAPPSTAALRELVPVGPPTARGRVNGTRATTVNGAGTAPVAPVPRVGPAATRHRPLAAAHRRAVGERVVEHRRAAGRRLVRLAS